jgi:hypothetical protein
MTDPATRPRIDFDYWVRLARENPQAFEQERVALLEQAIVEAAPRLHQRLRCLQWKLDTIRATSANPLMASLRMQRLLWDSVYGPNGLLERLQYLVDPDKVDKTAIATAKIIEFRR